MRKLAVYAFLIATLVRQGGFLCVEPGGAVRLEFAGACCLTETGENAPENFVPANAGEAECTDCRDIAICGESLSGGRQEGENSSSASMTPNLHALAAGDPAATVAVRSTVPINPAGQKILTTTRLRC